MNNFGGNWTEEKLVKLENYLKAYLIAMKKQSFTLNYIDALAGSGYRKEKNPHSKWQKTILSPELAEDETNKYREGSAIKALNLTPGFDQYLFIEKKTKNISNLNELTKNFSQIKHKIEIVNNDANECLVSICKHKNWKRNRAVLFLDPYGMQVNWSTIEAIAATKAIDLWYLFPVGIAVNRLLKNDGNITKSHRERLNNIFGSNDWYDNFYQEPLVQQLSLFGESDKQIDKVANLSTINSYFVKRLKEIFPGVAETPCVLRNSKNSPLYSLCFAAANPRGANIALRIAQYILKH